MATDYIEQELNSKHILYLVFTSYASGIHCNTVCRSLKHVKETLRESWETQEIGKGKMKYPTIKTLKGFLRKNYSDMCVEYPDGMWSTITRVHLSPKDIQEGERL